MKTKLPADDDLLDDLFSIGNLTEEQERQVRRLRAEVKRLCTALVESDTLLSRLLVESDTSLSRLYTRDNLGDGPYWRSVIEQMLAQHKA